MSITILLNIITNYKSNHKYSLMHQLIWYSNILPTPLFYYIRLQEYTFIFVDVSIVSATNFEAPNSCKLLCSNDRNAGLPLADALLAPSMFSKPSFKMSGHSFSSSSWKQYYYILDAIPQFLLHNGLASIDYFLIVDCFLRVIWSQFIHFTSLVNLNHWYLTDNKLSDVIL